MGSEHAAVIQYNLHAYTILSEALEAELEKIAREEMLHFIWFGQTIVGLGGTPDVTGRWPVKLGGPSAQDKLRLNQGDENDAVARYGSQAEQISDEHVTKILLRIQADEKQHAKQFAELIEEAANVQALQPGPLDAETERVVSLLNDDITFEYSAALQYLHQALLTPDQAFEKALLLQTVEDMKHLGWLAEDIKKLGAVPRVEFGPFDRTTASMVAMLKAGLALEQYAEAQYQSHIEQIAGPYFVLETLERIHEIEQFHVRLLGQLVEQAARLPAGGPPQPGAFTVGSLRPDRPFSS
jgi:rubrerythrin